MAKILLIDDDVELSALFQDYLHKEFFEVEIAHSGKQGLELAFSNNYDLIILDMMLPDMIGTEILTKIRLNSLIPILMFTAKGDDLDRIIGLESGADDYVSKPCTPRELAARIRAILRRTLTSPSNLNAQQHDIYVGPLHLSSTNRRASWFKHELDLTSTEFNLLETLAIHAGKIVSKEKLSEKSLGRPLAKYDRSIDVHISSIRQKLGKQQDGHAYIQTIRGKGYQLIKSE
jgi:DNA-binding response OmpR family regulator